MKTYSKNSSVRKPMMYGGMAAPTKKRKIMNVGGMATSMPMAGPFGAGMMADKKKKQEKEDDVKIFLDIKTTRGVE